MSQRMLARYYRLPTNGHLSFCMVESRSLSHEDLAIDPAYSSLARATTRPMVCACARPVWREHHHFLPHSSALKYNPILVFDVKSRPSGIALPLGDGIWSCHSLSFHHLSRNLCGNIVLQFYSWELWYAKGELHIMCGPIQANNRALLDLVSLYFWLINIYILTLYHSVGSLLSHKHVRP